MPVELTLVVRPLKEGITKRDLRILLLSRSFDDEIEELQTFQQPGGSVELTIRSDLSPSDILLRISRDWEEVI